MFGLFKKKGPFTATIKPAGESITVESKSSENLLKAALDSGLQWPHNCRVGSCGTCRCKLISGDIKPLNDYGYVLTEDEMDEGYILACQTMVKSDVEVEVALGDASAETEGIVFAKPREISGKIIQVSALTHDIVEVGVELEGEFSDYLPGQYADVTVPGAIKQPRSYSFSRSPGNEKPNHVSFIIRRVPDGEFTEWLYAEDRVGHPIELDGPHGSFFLRKTDGPLVFVAGGSGLSSIRALCQQYVEEGLKNDCTLIFGARTQKDLYCLDDIAAIAAKAKGNVNFVPCLSEEEDKDSWTGATGNCPDVITKTMLDKKSSHAYLCGPPVMVDVAMERLKKLGLHENRIFFDKFLDASTMPAARGR